jgi:hypothetical protein
MFQVVASGFVHFSCIYLLSVARFGLACLILHDYIIMIIFAEKYKLCSSSLNNFLHLPVTSDRQIDVLLRDIMPTLYRL